MGRRVYDLYMALGSTEEEGGLILKEGFMMLIFQGIMYELPPFEKYWTHMFQNKYMPVVGECQCEVLPFSRLRNELFSPEEDTNKYKYAMIGGVAVTAAKVLLADILDEKNPWQSICQVLGAYCVGIIHPMLTMRMVCSKWQSMILLKYIFGTMTCQLQYYGKIVLTKDGGVSQERVNIDLSCVFDTV